MTTDFDQCIQILGGLAIGGGLSLLLGVAGRYGHFTIRRRTGLYRPRRLFRRRYIFRGYRERRLGCLDLLGCIAAQFALCGEQSPVRYFKAGLFVSFLSHNLSPQKSAGVSPRSSFIAV